MYEHVNVHRFILSTPLRPGQRSFTLDPEETRHAVSVLRLKEGDSIQLCDGKGRWVSAMIERLDRKSKTLDIVSSKALKRNLFLRMDRSGTYFCSKARA